MRTSLSVRSIAIFGLAALASVAFAPWPTYADGLASFTGPTSISLTEDGTSHTFDYTLTNNSGGDLTNIGIAGGSFFSVVSPDFSDTPTNVGYGDAGLPGNCDSSTPLATGNSCTMALMLGLDSGSGETDADFGTSAVTASAQFTLPSGSQETLTVPVSITISDPTAAPEPSSLLLLGTGLAGLVGAARRKWLG